MKAASWPLILPKKGETSHSPPSDEDSHGFIPAPNDTNSTESVSSKLRNPSSIFKDQVIEFLRRLRSIDSNMHSQITNAMLTEPVLDLVQECHSIAEHEFEKEFSRLETNYYKELAEDYINKERDDGMNESDTFGTL
ncbi:hypothetical protein RHMOL_Rhmol08G0247300 [Rhododendron molle]|uniref:Uncharacterized protein n=1 Tax=Rhododendron molle TaxID=49168 RepID=A0ACC0MTC2_RHOML|nr:hypothetical protein RHMOL_Rhmol08G0247300 [Rhododendron molle]